MSDAGKGRAKARGWAHIKVLVYCRMYLYSLVSAIHTRGCSVRTCAAVGTLCHVLYFDLTSLSFFSLTWLARGRTTGVVAAKIMLQPPGYRGPGPSRLYAASTAHCPL